LLKNLFSSSDEELIKIVSVLQSLATRVNNIDSNTAYLTHRSDELLKVAKSLLHLLKEESLEPNIPNQTTMDDLDAISDNS